MWETLFPVVSEAGWKTFPKCKEGTEGHRALTRMGATRGALSQGSSFVKPGSPYVPNGTQSVPHGD